MNLRLTLIERLSTLCNTEPEKLSGNLSLFDLGVDSIVQMSLIASMEAELHCTISDEELLAILQAESIDSLLYVWELLARAKGMELI